MMELGAPNWISFLGGAVAIVAVLFVIIPGWQRVFSHRPLFSGPLPQQDSLNAVTSWVVDCFSQYYGRDAVELVMKSVHVTFTKEPVVGRRLHVLFNDDARKTSLDTVLSNAIVETLEPSLDRMTRAIRIAEAWLHYPRDYHTPATSRR